VGKREEELARLTSQVIRHFVQKTVVGDIAMFQQSSAQPQYPHAQRSQYGLHYRAMNDPSASFLQFLKGQEICQIAFGMYDLQIIGATAGFRVPGECFTNRAKVLRSCGQRVTRLMRYQCCVYCNRPLKSSIIQPKVFSDSNSRTVTD